VIGRSGLHRLLAGALLAVGVTGLTALAARAQTYTVSISASTPNIGNVVSASTGQTVFDVDPSTGNITKVSGNGVRLSTTTSRATVTVTCSNVNSCTTTDVAVRIGSIGTPTNRAGGLTNFAVASGTATIKTAATGTNPINFTLSPLPKTGGRTFYVGMDFPILGEDSGRSTGSASSGFYVYAAKVGTTPTSGSTSGLAVATVYRPISTTLNSNLAFGRVVRPASGSGTVSVDASTGARTMTAGAGLSSPSPTRAAYTVTGEGGQAFSISVPTSFSITGPSSLTVTTSSTATGSQVLSSTLGSAGTFGFGVGGSFPISSTTAVGSYSGTFGVTVQYN
jgi:hypothetical protein